MANSKRDIIKEKLAGNNDKATILVLENEIEQSNTQISKEIANVAQYNKEQNKLLEKVAKVTKSPACRLGTESKEECIARKMPELLDEGYEQDQAYAIAESLCSVACNEKIEIPKSVEVENVSVITDSIKEALLEVGKSNRSIIDIIKLENAKSYSDIADWLEKIATKDNKVIVNKESDKITIDLPTSPRKPIAVRLSDGDRFYNAVVAGMSATKMQIRNVIGDLINPATEEKQNDGNTSLSNIDDKVSTEATLLLVLNKISDVLTELNQKTEPNDNQQVELINSLRLVVQALQNPPYVDKSANAIRNQVQSGTVTTVTNLTNFGTQGADVTFRVNSNIAWANNVRQIIV